VTAVDLLTAVVRGDVSSWPASSEPSLVADFLAAAEYHNLAALAAWRLRAAGTLDEWPAEIRESLALAARQETLYEAGRESDLSQLASALQRAGVDCLWFKGAQLAHLFYAEPWLRPRSDSDVLIRSTDRDAAARVLTRLGFKPGNVLFGDFVGYQVPYAKTGALGVQHTVDLHWKIGNRPLLAEILSFDELWARSVALPRLSSEARSPSNTHALLIACLHPVVHHKNSDNLLWSHDIHLIATALGPSGLAEFAALAREKKIAAICATGLARAQQHFHTQVPAPLMHALAVGGEASAAYLTAAPWRGDVRLWDVRTLEGLSAKLRFAREVVFPSSDFMLKTYGRTNPALVPVLHAHRLFRGTWRLLHRFAR
jgi:hypothetical protein